MTHINSSEEEKKIKELSFPPLIHTQTTQELVIFEKIAGKTRLIYDEGKKKKRRQPLHHKQRDVTKTSVTGERGTSG